MKRSLLKFLPVVAIGGVLFVNICSADVLSNPIPSSPTDAFGWMLMPFAIMFFINLLIEVFFGWLIFFRHNKNGILTTILVNVVSQPLAIISLVSISTFFNNGLLVILIIESLVVIFEMIVYKYALDLSFRRSFLISLSLNSLSFFLGLILSAISILFIHSFTAHNRAVF